ncbi:hypothetical protein CPB83DRAFT_398001 [Crepidotus variabilis]|uniref:Uncharacterized protein n=1 Tax=Crepidotus variabilis TaxID=179855 RepID=A0A9P6EE85_9AGAR|nr:hypothetical protein CPB83DRAFT_398001 [Crepidotus variabilis]
MSCPPIRTCYYSSSSPNFSSSSCLSGDNIFSDGRRSTSEASSTVEESEYMLPKMDEDSEDGTNSDYSDGSEHLSIDCETLDDADDQDTIDLGPPLSSSPPEFRSSSRCTSIGGTPDPAYCFSKSSLAESPKHKSSQMRSGDSLNSMSSLLSVALKDHSILRSTLVPDTPVAETNCWHFMRQNPRGSLTPKGHPLHRLPTIKDQDESQETDLLDLDPGMEYETISPMSFASNQALDNSSINTDSAPNTRYRIIKRASSYLSSLAHEESPINKRPKLTQDSGVYTRIRPYAQRSATLRRADSLKSMVDIDSPNKLADTPIVSAAPHLAKLGQVKVLDPKKALPNPVPIIAPPIGYEPGLPLSEEICSRLRVNRFLERDSRRRQLDGFLQSFTPVDRTVQEVGAGSSLGEFARDARAVWEDRLGLGSVRRLNAINWILDVTPAEPDPDTLSSTNTSLSSSQSTLSSSTEDDQTLHEKSEGIDDLMDQLSTSHETRFHACWLFLRYFYAIMSPSAATPNSLAESLLSRSSSLDSQSSGDTERQGRDLIIWDIAVACLSLSVKFHRDFLGPLLPVYAHEYLYLSPHAMARDDLEVRTVFMSLDINILSYRQSAHRDVLSALEYSLGVSPQPLMDEFWFALPSLRALLDFQGGWSHALEDAWMFLFDAVCEPDVQRFSIPLLTTVAILDGIIESLVHRYRVEDIRSPSFSPSGSETEGSQRHLGRRSRRSREMLEQRAKEEAEGALLDVQALVGITDVFQFPFLPFNLQSHEYLMLT